MAKRRQTRAQTPEEIKIQEGLRNAQMMQGLQQQAKMQSEAEQKQNSMMVKMFTCDTARSLYVEAVANQEAKFESEEDFIKLADAANKAALILSERLGMIHPVTESGKAALEAATEAAKEEEPPTTTEGGIVLEE